MSTPPDWIATELHELQARGLRRMRRSVTPLPNGRCRLDGNTLVNFSTNDYLDLAGDERLKTAAVSAVRELGCGARASALVSGRTDWHARLEERLARFEREESAVLFPTGYAANFGTLTALAGPHDAVFCDRFNHASLIDGCRASGARLRVYRHTRLDRLERELKKTTGVRRRWIVTDAVFSMDGNLAPLRELCDLAERFDADVIVDEAHGTAVFGEQGRGVCEHLEVEDRIAVRIGTLSKAVGCLGGFVAGSADLAEWLYNTARPQVFSTALPPAVCAAAVAAFDVIGESSDRRRHLLHIAESLRTDLRNRDVAVPQDCAAPIVPVVIGEPEATVNAGRQLQQAGFLVPTIRPPTVPPGTSRLRISLCSAQTENDVQRLAAAIAEIVDFLPDPRDSRHHRR